MDSQQVVGTRLETFGAVSRLPGLYIIVIRGRGHMPAMLVQVQLIPDCCINVKQGQTFRSQHPLVTISHDEISLDFLYVDIVGANTLNRIDTVQNVVGLAEISQ